MNSAKEQKTLKSLGKRIAEIRKAKGVTQQQLAERINTSVVTIAYIETGKRSPRVWTLSKIADSLKVSISDLFKGV